MHFHIHLVLFYHLLRYHLRLRSWKQYWGMVYLMTMARIFHGQQMKRMMQSEQPYKNNYLYAILNEDGEDLNAIKQTNYSFYFL